MYARVAVNIMKNELILFLKYITYSNFYKKIKNIK